MTASYRLIALDFDGTLCDSARASVEIVNQLAKRHGFKPIEDAQAFRALTTRERVRALGVSPWTVPWLLWRGRRALRARASELAPYPGAASAISRLRSQGKPVVVVTSNSRSSVEAFARAHGFSFDAVDGSAGYFSKGRRLKAMARRFGLPPAECAYLGDETRDVEAAQAAGFAALGAGWGFADARILREAGAVATFETWDEFLGFASPSQADPPC